jgi:hypothetical protein
VTAADAPVVVVAAAAQVASAFHLALDALVVVVLVAAAQAAAAFQVALDALVAAAAVLVVLLHAGTTFFADFPSAADCAEVSAAAEVAHLAVAGAAFDFL